METIWPFCCWCFLFYSLLLTNILSLNVLTSFRAGLNTAVFLSRDANTLTHNQKPREKCAGVQNRPLFSFIDVKITAQFENKLQPFLQCTF